MLTEPFWPRIYTKMGSEEAVKIGMPNLSVELKCHIQLSFFFIIISDKENTEQ